MPANLERNGDHLHVPGADAVRHDAGRFLPRSGPISSFDRLEKLMISSAPARVETKRAVMEMFPNSGLFELYGSTEAGWVTMLHPHEQFDKLGTVGREVVGSAPILLLDDDGKEVPDGQPGELFSCSPYSFDGYWKQPEKTREAFRGDYCTVGDVALRDSRRLHPPDRPQEERHHHRRRECLSDRDRGRPGPPSRYPGCRGDRVARRQVGRTRACRRRAEDWTALMPDTR